MEVCSNSIMRAATEGITETCHLIRNAQHPDSTQYMNQSIYLNLFNPDVYCQSGG